MNDKGSIWLCKVKRFELKATDDAPKINFHPYFGTSIPEEELARVQEGRLGVLK